MKAVGSQRSDKHLEDSCSLFEVILGYEIVRQLLEQLQHVLVILDHRPAISKIICSKLIIWSPIFMKVQHLWQLSSFVHGVIDGVGWGTLLLLVRLLHLPRLLRHDSHLRNYYRAVS